MRLHHSVVGQFDFPGTNSGPSWVLGGGTRNRQCSTHMNVLTLCWAGGRGRRGGGGAGPKMLSQPAGIAAPQCLSEVLRVALTAALPLAPIALPALLALRGGAHFGCWSTASMPRAVLWVSRLQCGDHAFARFCSPVAVDV